MKLSSFYVFLWITVSTVPVTGTKVGPIEKVLQLLGDLQAKIIKEGESELGAYNDFSGWCKDTSREKMYEIKIGSAKKEDLDSIIEKAESDIEDASVRIEELTEKISSAENDLADATKIRERENKDFEFANKELTETISMLARAQKVLEKELAKSSFLQSPAGRKVVNIEETLKQIVEASGVQTSNMAELATLLQQHNSDNEYANEMQNDNDEELGAPDPEAYKSKSGGILKQLADMQEKAEDQQATAQKEEMVNKQNYMMLAMSLKTEIAEYKKEMDDHKQDKAEATEVKSDTGGKLEVVLKDLAADTKVLDDTRQECMARAEEFELEQTARAAELKTLAKAKKIIVESTQLQIGTSSASFLQISSRSSLHLQTGNKMTAAARRGLDDIALKAVESVRGLAHNVRSTALAQFAQRMSLEFRRRDVEDPFVKVKEMITNMIARLVKEAQQEAEQKGFCDQEMAEVAKSKGIKEADIADLDTKIEKMMSKSEKLAEEAKTLSKELFEQEKAQEHADKMRAEERTIYEDASAVLEKGLEGIQTALKVLRDYYAKGDEDEKLIQTSTSIEDSMQQSADQATSKSQTGGANAIIALLEVAESDLSKNLAELQAGEEAAQEEYDKLTQDNKVTKAAKTQDVKYKEKESKSLAKESAEFQNDLDGEKEELNAILEYETRLKPQCVAKAPSYEERKKRRDKEIAGLKNALQILEGESVFIQK